MTAIEHAGEAALLLRLDEPPSPELTQRLLAIARCVSEACGDGVACAPAYQTLMVQFDSTRITRSAVQQAMDAACGVNPPATPIGNTVVLPVLYDPTLAPDLVWLSEHSGLSIDDIISRHTRQSYHAYANGFAPGFCYLGDVDSRLAAPRMATPRRAVPAGAVGIADRQTGVYPAVSPGGWRIIGRCPTVLFDPMASPPNRIGVGDQVRFEAIDRDRYLALGGAE